MPAAGTLTEIISYEHPYIADTAYGRSSECEWRHYADSRAAVQYRSGARTNDNSEIFYLHTVTFIVRRFVQVEECDRIVWKGKRYRILSIEDQRVQQQLKIECELINE